MKISKRLKAICDFVPKNSQIIDIGADHALTDIYLEKYKNCSCLATDISKEALKKAIDNINKYESNIKTKVTDGLKNIILTDEIIILSVLGTHTIMKILKQNIKNDIIISSHTNIPLLKKFMDKKGYYIHNETVVFDKHYYVITYYKFGKRKRYNYIVSPFLKNNKQYLQYLYNKYETKYIYEKNIIKKIHLKFILKQIKNSL